MTAGRRHLQASRPTYAPGDRGIWVKSKCLNREEFVVVGWTDPEGSRRHIGALLLGYYIEDGRLHYAGRAGTGMGAKEKSAWPECWRRCRCRRCLLPPHPRAITASDLLLSCQRCIGVRPEVVVEVAYLTWTEGGLLRAVDSASAEKALAGLPGLAAR